MVKPYTSDTVSVIANFAKLSYPEQRLLLGKCRGFDRRSHLHSQTLTRLYHLIGIEKPHFQRRIDPRDLFRVFLVEPQQSVERLRAQSGAFLISAFHERFERSQIVAWNDCIPAYDHQTLFVPVESKGEILKELELLHVTRYVTPKEFSRSPYRCRSRRDDGLSTRRANQFAATAPSNPSMETTPRLTPHPTQRRHRTQLP